MSNRDSVHWTAVLREREELCRRAPSAHNTQPWVLRYDNDAVEVGWDPSRELPDGDPGRRDLFLSLGAFVETCLIVASDAGLAIRAEITVDEKRRTVARLLPAPDLHATPFSARTVALRGCARGAHTGGRLTAADLGAARTGLERASLVEMPARELAGLAVRADRWLFGTPPVVRELRTWLRLRRGHPRYADDGLTYEALAMSRVEAAALRAVLVPGVYGVLRRLGLARLLAGSQSGLLRYEGSVLVLTTAAGADASGAGAPAALVRAGQELVRVWYGLAERGIAVHPLSQILDCPRTEEELARRLGGRERPLAVFRAGRPTGPPIRSARLGGTANLPRRSGTASLAPGRAAMPVPPR
ncbi:hypothetical protein [Streptomyces sp. H39-S7]|uniref:hypothetical protein n=1 Tax=Streptomyces sp. H39-S7 TaxID=3004357 RepID=UPI0022AF183B|nr:hypothetical protein [Streptomyces sp. H39-S7]MCZ4122426.1 hypothetical protein [Streptomyces sp. H39-S7]